MRPSSETMTVKKAIEVDCVWENHREAVDNPLARLVHLDLAF